MSPRARAAAGNAAQDGETPPAVTAGEGSQDGTPATIVEMEPPARTRAVKHTLSDPQLQQFATALVDGKWAGTGETFNGEDAETAEKRASNMARVWRREIARYLNCEEREIRTRIWETAQAGYFTCAVKLRDGSKVALPETAPVESGEDSTGEDGE